MAQTNRGRKQAKFYLSPEAKELLEKAAAREMYDMSTMLDMLIKKHLGEAISCIVEEHPPAPTPETFRYVEERNRKQETQTDDFQPDF